MGRETRQGLKRSGRDFVCALLAFCFLFAAITMDREIANPMLLATHMVALIGWPSLDGLPAVTQQEFPARTAASLAAAVLFSVIVAFNLAFLRHLRRVHASSRRGAWRES